MSSISTSGAYSHDELAALARAHLPETVATCDALDALNTLRALAAASEAAKHLPGLRAPLGVEATLYAVARELRILSRLLDGDRVEDIDVHDSLVRHATALETAADLVRLQNVAMVVALDSADDREKAAE